MTSAEGGRVYRLEIAGTWNGGPLASGEHARVDVELGDVIEVRVEASFHDDPPPDGPAGRLDGLWEYEVVELFLLGAGDAYLEIELGPHGHWLGLGLEGRRRIVRDEIPIDFQSEQRGDRWRGEARIEACFLPRSIRGVNAYALHGVGAERRYLAAHPVPGPAPDFHRLEHFAALDRHRLR